MMLLALWGLLGWDKACGETASRELVGKEAKDATGKMVWFREASMVCRWSALKKTLPVRPIREWNTNAVCVSSHLCKQPWVFLFCFLFYVSAWERMEIRRQNGRGWFFPPMGVSDAKLSSPGMTAGSLSTEPSHPSNVYFTCFHFSLAQAFMHSGRHWKWGLWCLSPGSTPTKCSWTWAT